MASGLGLAIRFWPAEAPRDRQPKRKTEMAWKRENEDTRSGISFGLKTLTFAADAKFDRQFHAER